MRSVPRFLVVALTGLAACTRDGPVAPYPSGSSSLRSLGSVPALSTSGVPMRSYGSGEWKAINGNQDLAGSLNGQPVVVRNGQLEVIDLPIGAPPQEAILVWSMNEHGAVSGSFGDFAFQQRGFIWRSGAATTLGTLGPRGCCNYSDAFGINDAGVVVGRTSSPSGQRAFKWENGVMSDLGSLLGGDGQQPNDVNNSGAIVGSGYVAGTQVVRAFLLDGGVLTTLPDLGGDWCDASAINDAGQIAGACNDANGVQRAVRWDGGVITNLTPDVAATARAINNQGQVVGHTLGFGRPARAFVWHNGTARDLGTLPGSNSSLAFSISDAGVVAGTSEGQAVTWELTPPAPADATPPVVTPLVRGDIGDDNWYVSDVTVEWMVSDDESTATADCPPVPLTINTSSEGVTFKCVATSEGGTTTGSVTVKRDASAPIVAFTGATSYTVDQNVDITCAASDPTPGSGLRTHECPSVSGPAYLFVGVNPREASAVDHAGNRSTASLSFTVRVTTAGIIALTERWVQKPGVAHSLVVKLTSDRPQVNAFVNEVRAQAGKSVDADKAAILIRLAGLL